MLQVHLKVVGGRQDGKLLPLPPGRFLVGREEDCQLRPKSELVSRHHCVFNVDEFTVRLRDLGSTNGTHVNDERILGQVVLKQGDEVRIGKLEFTVQMREVTEPVPVEETAALDETTADSSGETLVDVEIPEEIAAAGEDFAEQQTVIDSPTPVPQVQLQPPVQMQPMPGQPMPMYPGYGYPQYPGYPPQMPYPGQPYPGYPPMPPGYPPPQGMPPGMMPEAPAAPTPTETPTTTSAEGKTEVSAPPMKLPDPSETGVKAAEPAAEKPKPAPTPNGVAEENPSQRAENIIRQYMKRGKGDEDEEK